MYDTTAPNFPKHVEIDERRISTITLPSFSGSQYRNGPYGAISSNEKSNGETHVVCDAALAVDQFDLAVQWIISNDQNIRDALLESLVDHYREMREVEIECLQDADPDVVLPIIQNSSELLPLCGLVAVHVNKLSDSAAPRFGIELGCNWEPDHGAGARFSGLTVEAAGESDYAFMF